MIANPNIRNFSFDSKTACKRSGIAQDKGAGKAAVLPPAFPTKYRRFGGHAGDPCISERQSKSARRLAACSHLKPFRFCKRSLQRKKGLPAAIPAFQNASQKARAGLQPAPI
jgi:hypothetical protein